MLRPHEHRLRVRYAETDQMGVTHHASYVLYFEDARTRMMEALGLSYAELERDGYGLVVRKLELRYRSPAHFDEELSVLSSVERVRAASVVILYRIERSADRELLVTGSIELACVGLGPAGPGGKPSSGPCMLPEHAREVLQRGIVQPSG